MKKNKEDKVHAILSQVMCIDTEKFMDLKAHKELSDFVKRMQDVPEYKHLQFSTFVKDISKSKWKQKDRFVKIFKEEIRYVKELYDLSRHEVLFLYSLSEFVSWELNLIVDEENNAINRKSLAKKMECNESTIYRNMKKLEECNCVFSIPFENETFYLVNPFLMYYGANINSVLPCLFLEQGYVPNEEITKNNKKSVGK